MRRLTPIAVLASILVASCSGSSQPAKSSRRATTPSATSTDAPKRTVEVNFAFGPPDLPWTIDPSASGGFVLHGSGRYTGDWIATSTYAYARQDQGAKFAALSLGVLDGNVKGCGSGTFVLVVASVEPTLHAGWLIAPGYGTPDLASLNGSGPWTTTQGNLTSSAASGKIQGTMTCTGGPTPSSIGPFYGTARTGTVKVNATDHSMPPAVAWSGTVNTPGGATIELSDGDQTAQINGTWTGDSAAHFAKATNPTPNANPVEAKVMRINGTFTGCGTGSIVVAILDRAGAQGAPGVRVWEVVPGLGTGALTGATGFGTGTTSVTAGTGTFKGAMSCHG